MKSVRTKWFVMSVTLVTFLGLVASVWGACGVLCQCQGGVHDEGADPTQEHPGACQCCSHGTTAVSESVWIASRDSNCTCSPGGSDQPLQVAVVPDRFLAQLNVFASSTLSLVDASLHSTHRERLASNDLGTSMTLGFLRTVSLLM